MEASAFCVFRRKVCINNNRSKRLNHPLRFYPAHLLHSRCNFNRFSCIGSKKQPPASAATIFSPCTQLPFYRQNKQKKIYQFSMPNYKLQNPVIEITPAAAALFNCKSHLLDEWTAATCNIVRNILFIIMFEIKAGKAGGHLVGFLIGRRSRR